MYMIEGTALNRLPLVIWRLGKHYCVPCAKLLQSCLILCDPMDCSLQAPLSMDSNRQENWSGLPCPPPGDLPDSGIEPRSLMSPALSGGFFTTSTTWEAQSYDEVSVFFDEPVALDCELHRCFWLFLPFNWGRMAGVAGAGYFLSPGHLDSDNTEFSEGGLLRTENSGMFQNGSFSSPPVSSPREIF